MKKHGEEANNTSASIKGACESPPVGFMLVLPLLFLYLTLTTKMEDSIAKLKHFSKLDFQSKREVINTGRETNAGAKRYASNALTEDNSIDYSHSKPNCFFGTFLEPQE